MSSQVGDLSTQPVKKFAINKNIDKIVLNLLFIGILHILCIIQISISLFIGETKLFYRAAIIYE